MSLESLYADRIEEGLQRDLANPPRQAPPNFSTWSMLSAGAKGLPAAGLEVAASIGDLLAPAAAEVARRPNFGRGPGGIFENAPAHRPDDPAMFSSSAKALRQSANSFYPDPETSHVADQTLFGLTRVASKAVPAVLAAGPYGGAALLGAEETNTQYRALIAKGVDPDTALKVAGVQGAVTGASVGVPLVGPTVASTLGLMAATGPGAYMAQETMARNILAKAGYQNEASLHNPTDPLGLTISTILPGVFGAVHIAGLARRPSLADVALGLESGGKRFGKDGKLLTSPKGAKGEMQVMPDTATDPGFGVVPAKDSSPDELARVGRDYIAAMQARYGDPDKALAAYNAGPGAVDKAIAAHPGDWLAHLPEETQKYVTKGMKKLGDQTVAHAAENPEAVDAARVRVTNDALNRSLPDHPEARAEVMRAHEELAAGRVPLMEPVPTTSLPEFKALSDLLGSSGVARDVVAATDKPTMDRLQGDAKSLADLVERPAGGAHGDGGGQVPLSVVPHVLGATENPQILDAVVRALPVDVVDFLARQKLAPKDLLRNETMLKDVFAGKRAADIALGIDKAAPALLVRSVAETAAKVAGLARRALEADAANPARMGGLGLSTHADSLNGFGDRNPRSEGTNALPPPERVTIEPETQPAKGEPVQSPAAQAVAKLVEETPGLKVKLPGSDETLTVATALERAKAAAAEEAKEADWVKAALECALSFGG